ncbi:ABC transporter ATP-binding protein [Geobacillus stearothermophilus]|uniref:ABC transporter ATP-binding protein n=1 Tax=Geobacillus stearothermophilus TaxID=1422 RepID=UPI0007D9DC32|nr:ABC transporter ATP-binding protein [Geobacillus stearothermophilus]OAO78636.1 ABC transporter ATP-binding protein [Geobacillus stearothermophilus]
MKIIEVYNLKKKFKDHYVVKGVTFDVKKGEVFGFLGKNGAGKTTTMNMLTGIILPTEGSFTIGGKTNQEIDQIKRIIGVMPDAANYYYDLTAIEHLIFFSKLKKLKMKNSDLLAILERVGLKGHEKKKVGSYSFGMKKKLGIAQAILGKPQVVFLDEPTSGLDPESAVEIQQLIQELSQDHMTIFLTSHNLIEVERICDRIAIMENGIISKIGSMEELRALHQRTIRLSIKIKKEDSFIAHSMKNNLVDYVSDIQVKDQYLYCYLYKEADIPKLIHYLSSQNIDIYEVKTEKATLEDIFFDRTSRDAIDMIKT